MKKLGVQDDDLGTTSGKIMDLTSRDFGNQLLQMLKKDRSLIGKTVNVTGLGQGRRRPLLQGRDQALDRRGRPQAGQPAAGLAGQPAQGRHGQGRLQHPVLHQLRLHRARTGRRLGRGDRLGHDAADHRRDRHPGGRAGRGLSGRVRAEEPLDRHHRGQHQQPRGRALDRLRPAGSGPVHQLAARAARFAAGRRPGPGPDGPADRDHRHPQRPEGGAAVDPRSRPGRRRLARPRPCSTTCCRWPCRA